VSLAAGAVGVSAAKPPLGRSPQLPGSCPRAPPFARDFLEVALVAHGLSGNFLEVARARGRLPGNFLEVAR